MIRANALDEQVQFSFFRSNNLARGERFNIKLLDMENWINAGYAYLANHKEQLPLIKLATFENDYRSDASAEWIYGIEADYDGEIMPPDVALWLLQKAGIAALVYTSPSHRPGAPRLRFLSPTSEPLPPSERHELVSRVNGALGGILAPESWTLSQAYYIGSVTGGHPVQAWTSEGLPIDQVHGIAPQGPPQSDGKRKPLGTLPTVAIEHVRAALQEIDPAQLDYHDWRDVTAAYRGAGGDREPWDAWCTLYAANDSVANAKLWRSLDRGTMLGWPYLARKAPLAGAAAAFGGGQPAALSVQSDILPMQPYQLPVGCDTTGAPSHLDVVTHCRNWNLPVAHNTFANRLVVTGKMPNETRDQSPRLLSDNDYTLVRLCFNAIGLKPGTEALRDGVDFWARMNAFNPVTDWLRSLQWDGVPRADSWLSRYMAVADDEWSRIVGPKFLIAMVARAMQPGCQLDTAMIFEGVQGLRKSSALRALAGDQFFGDQLPSMSDKEGLQFIRGLWLVEIKELAAYSKSEVNDIKRFIDARIDRYRDPFGRTVNDHPRSACFAATTNESEYLKDSTGERRWWPVRCNGPIDVEGLQDAREQLFAEAVHRYDSGEIWHLTDDQDAIARVEQGKRRKVSEYFERIAAKTRCTESVRMEDVFVALGLSTSELNNPQYTSPIARDLAMLGFQQKRQGGTGARFYSRTV